VLHRDNDLLLLKKNKKSRKNKLDKSDGRKLYYEFTSAKKYVLFSEGVYKSVNTMSEIKGIFPDTKKEIKTFYQKNKRLKKSDPDRFMKRLFETILQSSSKIES